MWWYGVFFPPQCDMIHPMTIRALPSDVSGAALGPGKCRAKSVGKWLMAPFVAQLSHHKILKFATLHVMKAVHPMVYFCATPLPHCSLNFFLCTDALANAVCVARRIWWTDLGGLTKPACKEEWVGGLDALASIAKRHIRFLRFFRFLLKKCKNKVTIFVHLHLLRPRSLLISPQWGTVPICNFACSMVWKRVRLVDWVGRPHRTNL